MNQDVAQYITNLATNNKWILHIPISKVLKNSNKDLILNIYSFDIPEIAINKVPTEYHGTTVDLPGDTKEYEKEITFTYLLSENWEQYFMLYDWITKIIKEVGSGANYKKLEDIIVPARIYILSAFKHPIAEIVLNFAYISRLGGISASYQEGEDVVSNSFTLTYFYLELNRLSQDELT